MMKIEWFWVMVGIGAVHVLFGEASDGYQFLALAPIAYLLQEIKERQQ